MSAYDVVVIGSGIAGLTATKHLLEMRRSLKVANVEAELFGGLVVNVNELDGDVRGSGMELAAGLMMEATELGAEALSERVTTLSEDASGWLVTTSDGRHQAHAVIIASGASLKKFGVPGEAKLENRGISHCADCDGPLYSGKDVVVAGGGDSALQEAGILARFCRRVSILNRGAQFTAKSHLIDAIASCINVETRHRTVVTAILGSQAVEKVQFRNLADDSDGEITCSGLFGFIGLAPSSGFVPPTIPRDAEGRIRTDGALKAANRLFAAGAVRSGNGGMLEHAIADGRAAADEVIRALA